MSDNIPVIGVLRFSFFGQSDLVQSHTDDAALSDIYDPDRMESRFWFFEHIMLPSLKHQSDQDFKFIIVSSDVMPEVHQKRLLNLVKDIPQIQTIFAKTKSLEGELAPILTAMCEGSKTGLVNTFRLDDDDAVSTNYIARLKEVALPRDRTVITFPRTICAFEDFDGTFGVTQHVMYCTAIGLARMISPTTVRSPYAMHHSTVWRHNLTLSDPSFYCNLRSYHFHQDTKARRDINLGKMIAEMGPDYKTPKYMDFFARNLESDFSWTTLEALEKIYLDCPRSIKPA